MKTYYDITYRLICDQDGLVSHTLKSIKEIVPNNDEEDEDNKEETNGKE
jgi:hypothetical protein